MTVKRLLIAVCMVALSACSVDKQTAPPLTGPSGLGLSLDVRATPDSLTRDGLSRSTIEVTATDGSGKRISNLDLRFMLSPSLGTLTGAATTDASGRATATYTAPGNGGNTYVTVTVTPSGNNFDNIQPRVITIQLLQDIGS